MVGRWYWYLREKEAPALALNAMDETNRNSAKLDIEAARQQSADKENSKEKLSPEPKESYKKLSDAELDQANGAARKQPADSDGKGLNNHQNRLDHT